MNSIAQDQEGFMWVGTRYELNRFDGYDIATYRSVDGDSLSLDDDNVWSLIVGRDGVLWIGTGEGLNRYDPNHDRIERIPLKAGDTVASTNVRVLFEDSRRQLWVGTDQGLFRREPDTGDFRLYKAVPSSLGLYFQDANKVVALGEDRQGRLWVGTRAGLNLLDETSAAFYPTTPLPAERDRIEDEVRHLLGDDKGGLWVATQQNGLFHFDSAAEVLTTYDRKAPASHRIPSNSVRFVYLDEGAYPVIGTATGLSIYDPIGQTLVHHTHMAGDPTG